MLQAAEKARKALSNDVEFVINIEELFEEENLECTLTREEFQKIIIESCKKLSSLLRDTIAKLNQIEINYTGFDVVELLGECTRIPIF